MQFSILVSFLLVLYSRVCYARSLKGSSFDSLPVYFINLSNEKIRRGQIKKSLASSGFPYSKRISAWIPRHVEERVLVNMTSPGTNLRSFDIIQKELGCIASHIFAIYTAVYDKEQSHIPYALITEDDLRFELKVNWRRMIEESAPKKWKILQVFTSNGPFTKDLWTQYKEDVKAQRRFQEGTSLVHSPNPTLQWKERVWNSSFWSTQAYVINKESIKPLLSSLVYYNMTERKYFLTLQPPSSVPCLANSLPSSCSLPFRIVADIYLYSYFSPSFMTRIPFINGAKHTSSTSSSSDIQPENKLSQHAEHFEIIDAVIQEIKYSARSFLPSYFHLSSFYNPFPKS
jgi:GR25 family glycosyltransferase involved in LPS biosynthesis